MRRIGIIVMAAIVAFDICGCDKTKLDKVKDVSIVQIDSLENECIYRYHIQFSNDVESGEGNYWVGLAKVQSSGFDSIIAYGSPATFQQPVHNASLAVDLTPTNAVMPGDMMLGIAVRGDNAGSLQNSIFGVSENTAPAPSFPQECGSFALKLWSGGMEVYDGDCVYISEDPLMPALTAGILPGQLAGNVEWSLKIRYTRNGRNDSDVYVTTLPAANDWRITPQMGAAIRGGQATLYCHSIDSNAAQAMTFGIRAYNASESEIITYINNIPDVSWYYQYVAKREGGQQEDRWYLQFNEGSDLLHNCGPAGVRYTPNSDGAGGFGIYQLTAFEVTGRPPNAQELWNWRE